jgi:hypothetical protein
MVLSLKYQTSFGSIMRSDTYHRALAVSGYMIGSAIVALSIASLPALAGTILSTLNIVPAHLM